MPKILLSSSIQPHLVPVFCETVFPKKNSVVLYMPPVGDNPKNTMYFKFWKVLAKSQKSELIFLDNTTEITDVERELFKKADSFIATGGNTYSFLYYIKKNGYFEEMKNFLKREDTNYLGMSAGSILTSKDISISRDENLFNINDFEGLGVTDRTIIVHYEGENDTRKLDDYDDPIVLTDDEYLIIDN